MRDDKHISPNQLMLFLRSGVYLEAANEFLSLEQIDEVGIEHYLS